MKFFISLCLCYSLFFSFSFTQELYRDHMRNLIKELRKNTTKEKIFISQNGNALYFRDGILDMEAFSLTEGTTQESLYYGDELNFNKVTPQKSKKEFLSMLIPLKEAGKIVFTINYGKGEKNRKKLKQEAEKNGFVNELLPGFEATDLYEPIQAFHQKEVLTLNDAKNFLCLLNPEKFENLDNYYRYLKNMDYDILIIETSLNGEFLSKNQIESLKYKTSGARRLVIAYFSIGEAEDYRYYWKNHWLKKKPDWIVAENKNWKGNYMVKYWSAEWRKIIKEYQKKLDAIGVDGYLLDTVDTYYYFEDMDEQEKT